MTAEQLANLSRMDEDDENLTDDLARQLGVEADYNHRRYNDLDITVGLAEIDDHSPRLVLDF